jgi:hypothetical protein
LEFHHIPVKRTLLEFNLSKDIEDDEILDYCILHGDTMEELTIQSFFNFAVQKFTKLRLITTMCDTLACFLGLDTDMPLAQFPLLVGKKVTFIEIVLAYHFPTDLSMHSWPTIWGGSWNFTSRLIIIALYYTKKVPRSPRPQLPNSGSLPLRFYIPHSVRH